MFSYASLKPGGYPEEFSDQQAKLGVTGPGGRATADEVNWESRIFVEDAALSSKGSAYDTRWLGNEILRLSWVTRRVIVEVPSNDGAPAAELCRSSGRRCANLKVIRTSVSQGISGN